MAYIEIEVDLDKFDTDELFQELDERIRKMKPEQLKKFRRMVSENQSDGIFEPKTMVESMKIELFKKNINKKTLQELEVFYGSN